MLREALKKILSLLLCTVLIAGIAVLPATASAAESGYTYSYDWWEDPQLSPDFYETIGVYTATDLGLDLALSKPEGLFVHDGFIYICDTGNNRIIELKRDNAVKLSVNRIIDTLTGNADVLTLNQPTDIAFDGEGNMYIADMNNQRVVKCSPDLEYIMQFNRPVDANIKEDATFIPRKLATDVSGRVYCVATNINQGLVKYEADGTFVGFIGANKAVYNFYDYLRKRLATQEQRDLMVDFVPTEYTNIFMDSDGFLFVCSVNVKEEDVFQGNTDSVRRLNLLGNDILIENGVDYVAGDFWTDGGESGYTGMSLFTDVTAFENGVYVCLDKTRSRLFGYDDQGRTLFCFGGPGNLDGYFRGPVALDHYGYDLIVLDQIDCSITLFTPTEFGKTVYNAIDEFSAGHYENSETAWRKAMALNGNYDMAYIGIGRALLRQKEYKEAMEYFELKWDDKNYSKAYKQYRKVWAKENIGWIVAIIAVIVLVPLIRGRLKKIKFQIDTADIFKYNKYDV